MRRTDSCPNATVWRTSCKNRTCPTCGPRWARDQYTRVSVNFGVYSGPVVMISITPPGAERLPWDEEHCAPRRRPGRPHHHSGKRGCRVQQRAARGWIETLTLRMRWLRNAAQMQARRRTGQSAHYLGYVIELQRRGVPHYHLVVGYGSPADIAAAHAFAEELARLAGSYDFGFVDRKIRPVPQAEVVRYLAAYLVGRSSGKPALRELLDEPAMRYLLERGADPRRFRRRISLPLVWVSPSLSRRTLVTMRTLRRARHVWAALRDPLIELPRWASVAEAVKVGAVFRRIHQRRGPPPEEALEVALGWAREIDPRLNFLNRQEPATAALRAVLALSAAAAH